MASVRARLGTALAVAVAATLLPAVSLAPASATTAGDGGGSTIVTTTTISTTTISATTTSTATLASATTTTLVAPSLTYALPYSRTGYVSITDAALASPTVRGKAVIDTARRFKGVPYVAGGTSPATGFDCSGYTRYVFSRLHLYLPRVSRDQYSYSIHITRAQAVPGDLVFFYSSSGRIYHAAIYAGNGYIWHSPYPGQRVKLEKIWSSRVKFARARV